MKSENDSFNTANSLSSGKKPGHSPDEATIFVKSLEYVTKSEQ